MRIKRLTPDCDSLNDKQHPSQYQMTAEDTHAEWSDQQCNAQREFWETSSPLSVSFTNFLLMIIAKTQSAEGRLGENSYYLEQTSETSLQAEESLSEKDRYEK